MKTLLALACFALPFSLPTPTYAFEIHPGALATMANKGAIHEQLSLESIACAAKADKADVLTCQWSPLEKYITEARPQLTDKQWVVMRGVQWPDNPVRTAVSKDVAGFTLQMLSGCVGHNHELGGLVCKSHNGDLQFMHAMAIKQGQTARETREQILTWLHFVYEAIRKPSLLDLTLGELIKGPRFVAIAPALAPPPKKPKFSWFGRGVRMPSWVAFTLFSYVDAHSPYSFNGKFERHPDLKDYSTEFLLGVMLHTIQDSYSGAHSQRGAAPVTSARITCRKIKQFFTYPGQDSGKHGACDKAPDIDASCNSPTREVDDPVLAGARLIRFAAEGAEWSEVQKYLKDRVFAIDEADLTNKSTNGPFTR